MKKIQPKNRNLINKTPNINLLIQQGKYHVAIDALKKNLLFSLNKKNDYKTIGLCYYSLKDFKNCLTYLHQADHNDLDVLMAISQASFHMDDLIQMKKFGQRVIIGKMQLYHQPNHNIKLEPVKPLSLDPTKNIISFSIFGNNSRYCETAILNAKEAKDIYPHWTCRFYLDDSVPAEIVKRLENEGAQIIRVNSEITQQMNGLFWRFLVIDDPTVERFMIRDADSIISLREAAAVENWINSNTHFHIMRDAFAHTELVMAGMWGGCNGVIKNIGQMILAFLSSYDHKVKREYDQHFLRVCIWPFIEQSYTHHDSTFESPNSIDFPPHSLKYDYEKHNNFHVGWDINSTISLPSDKPNGDIYQWQILDQENNIICNYSNQVSHNKFNIIVPIPYLNNLNHKIWSIKILNND